MIKMEVSQTWDEVNSASDSSTLDTKKNLVSSWRMPLSNYFSKVKSSHITSLISYYNRLINYIKYWNYVRTSFVWKKYLSVCSNPQTPKTF